ncbi:MAG: hypothetical protein KDD94_01375 [Calditrichaeota bacterium]|nr:hypothetical protein [Calditrichota bacterium]
MIQFLLLITSYFSIHPFHVSVCEITHSRSEQSLQITQRIFLDDLEKTLNSRFNLHLDLLKEANHHVLDSLMIDYLGANLKIYVDSKIRKTSYLGFEIENKEAMWVYLEIPAISKMDLIEVQNSILLEMFDDQVNLVHVSYNDEVKSLHLAKNQPFDFINYKN